MNLKTAKYDGRFFKLACKSNLGFGLFTGFFVINGFFFAREAAVSLRGLGFLEAFIFESFFGDRIGEVGGTYLAGLNFLPRVGILEGDADLLRGLAGGVNVLSNPGEDSNFLGDFIGESLCGIEKFGQKFHFKRKN